MQSIHCYIALFCGLCVVAVEYFLDLFELGVVPEGEALHKADFELSQGEVVIVLLCDSSGEGDFWAIEHLLGLEEASSVVVWVARGVLAVSSSMLL